MAVPDQESPGLLRPFRGPKLLVFREKHGERYFLVQNEAQLHAIALHVLQERVKAGIIPSVDNGTVTFDDLKNVQRECSQIEAIQDLEIRTAAFEAWKNRIHFIKECLREKLQIRAVQHVLDVRHGPSAWSILEDRSTYSNEGYQLTDLCNPPGQEIPYLPRPEIPVHGLTWTDPEGKRWVYDEKTVKGWIPQLYAWLIYNVKAHITTEPVLRLSNKELSAYEERPKAVEAS